jgi:hypothetical protein
MQTTLTATIFACLVALATPATAQERLTDLHRILPRGERIVVTDTSGHTTEATVAGIESTGLRIIVDGVNREIAESDVREIHRRGDSLRNGAIIGAVAGGALGAVGGYYLSMLFENEARSGVGPFIYVIGIGAASGAAIGAGVDALIPGKTLVYRRGERTVRVAPMISADARGASVRINF